nr:retrotransposable element Tf2 [Tanacetum cinerariifolium]
EGQLFSLVILADEVEMDEELMDVEEDLVELVKEELVPQISLNALCGVSSFQTLVDSGSTHNFLDIHVARRLGYNIRSTYPLSVSVARDRQLDTFDTLLCRVDISPKHAASLYLVILADEVEMDEEFMDVEEDLVELVKEELLVSFKAAIGSSNTYPNL